MEEKSVSSMADHSVQLQVLVEKDIPFYNQVNYSPSLFLPFICTVTVFWVSIYLPFFKYLLDELSFFAVHVEVGLVFAAFTSQWYIYW